ncbi:hypothetical protein BDV93DRAFT_585099 [Ceratobasidium sp. AG-I]|nr:hypothetical protein BDV93DRAFT_585099 [Ceratobasidium sp. AG-I]
MRLIVVPGHVFCRPCLESLVTSAPSCPNCRALFGRKSIRKVVCTLQDPPTLDASTLSEAEMMMWQTIESAVESLDEHEQRRSLIRDNSKEAVRETGFSRNLLVALDVMRLLVQVESTNRSLGAARAVEESLRDRISFYEAQVSGTKATVSSNIQDIQKVLSNLRQLESSMCTTDDMPPQTTGQQASAGLLPIPPNSHHMTLNTSDYVPPHMRNPHNQQVSSAYQGWGQPPEDQHSISSPPRPQPSSSTRTPAHRTITALYNYTANEPTELSLTAGEIVRPSYDSGDMDDGREWVLCRVRGEEGYVPRDCLSVTYEIWE